MRSETSEGAAEVEGVVEGRFGVEMRGVVLWESLVVVEGAVDGGVVV